MRVAIVGATGAVGKELLNVLEGRRFPVEELVLFASPKSHGKTLEWKGKTLTVEGLTSPDQLRGCDMAFFSAGSDLSKKYAWEVARLGCVVIDNSSAWRMDDRVPLVVPEINPDALVNHPGVIANPNCSTIIALMALDPLHKRFGLVSFIASTYQAASGAGEKGIDELQEQIKRIEHGEDPRKVRAEVFPGPLAYNAIPQIGPFLPNGFTAEEMKLTYESRKILSTPHLLVDAHCTRIPVLRAHSISITAQFSERVDLESAKDAFLRMDGLTLYDDAENDGYPMPLFYTGGYDCGVGRIRKSLVSENGLMFWVVGDQILKGAALNAVQIGECLI